jgi:hypothetical protein
LQQSGLVGRATLESAWPTSSSPPRAAPGHPPDHTLLGQILVRNGVLSENQLRAAIAAWLGDPVIDPRLLAPDPAALALVPRHVAERESVLPLLLENEVLVLLMADPWDQRLLDELRFLTQHRLLPALAAPGTLQPTIDRFYPASSLAPGARAARRGRPARCPSRPTRMRWPVNWHRPERRPAHRRAGGERVRQHPGAPDQHLDRRGPGPPRLGHPHRDAAGAGAGAHPAARRRRLLNYLEVPSHWRFALVTRLKIMADLDISEHRKPQDGKIDFSRFGNSRLELRVVTVPTSQGLEDVVLRLLGSHRPLPLDSIGLSPRTCRRCARWRRKATAWSWSAAPPAAARPPRCTR